MNAIQWKKWIDRNMSTMDPTWDIEQPYLWNFENGPLFNGQIPPYPIPREPRKLLDFTINSLVGVAAGPLLNSMWIRLYAELGFGILTYKTVRTKSWPAYPNPNIAFVQSGQLLDSSDLPATLKVGAMPKDTSQITITNSFGMPSPDPVYWRQDVCKAKGYLNAGQLLIVSVAGTVDEGDTLDELARDFVKCADWAAQAGADVVEANLSCPNVSTEEGQLYLDVDAGVRVVGSIREAIGKKPLAVKLGYFPSTERMVQFIKQIGPLVDFLVAINSVNARIVDALGRPTLPGRETSGVCGMRIRKLGLQTVANISRIRRELGLSFRIIGCGGIATPTHVQEYLDAGADAVETATMAIWNPYLALEVAISDKAKGLSA